MSGPISIGVGGIAGWRIVQRSEARQIQSLAKDPIVQRSTTYFQENIARTTKAEELVKDYRLLSTALSAFGLESDIANKAFIQKVLESDVSDKKSLVNRLADKRYLKMAEAFGFGSPKPADKLADTVSQAFVQREFERRISEGNNTLQIQTLARDPAVQRSTTYFRENIARVAKAEDLIKDSRLFSTALSAFGLEADIENKGFIQKVLESDISDKKSLVNGLADKRYLKMAEAFGFGSAKPVDKLGETVSKAFVQREFERRIGEGDETLRFALNARRELQEMGNRTSSDKTLWYEVLGSPPMRKVFEGAFGFDKAYGRLPIDRQYEEFTRAAERTFGSSSFKNLSQPDAIDRLVQNYMVRSQISTSPAQNRYSAALTLLRRG